MPGYLDVAGDRRQHDLLRQAGDRATRRAGAPWRLVDHFVELDDGLAPKIGHHRPGLRNGAQDRRRRGAGRAARRRTLARTAERQGAQEQPSDLSLSASTCRWSRHARSFSRSLATTSAGARATNCWLVSLAVSPASCCSSRVSSPESRRHSCCTSIAPSSATYTSLPSPNTAYAPTRFDPPSNDSSSSCARRRIVSLSASNTFWLSRPRAVMLARRRVFGGTLYSARMLRICSTTCLTRRNCKSSSESTSSGLNDGHAAAASSSSAVRPGSFCHSSSVMNGTTGCSRRSAVSKQWARTA